MYMPPHVQGKKSADAQSAQSAAVDVEDSKVDDHFRKAREAKEVREHAGLGEESADDPHPDEPSRKEKEHA